MCPVGPKLRFRMTGEMKEGEMMISFTAHLFAVFYIVSLTLVCFWLYK